MERGLCRISNFENRTTTGRAIAILLTEIKIEKRYGNIGADVHMYTVQGGGATLWQKIGPLRGEGPRGQYLFCTTLKVLLSTWPFLWYIYVPQFRILSRIHLISYKIWHF